MLRFTPALCVLLLLVETAAAQALNRVETQLRRNEPGYLGVVADDRGENGAGARILEVVAGGPADLAGLRVNDLVTAVNGKAVRSLDDLGRLLEGARVGTRVEFRVERGRELKKFPVTLGLRPTPAERIAERIDPDRAPEVEPPPNLAPAKKRTLLGVRTVRMNLAEQIRLRSPTVIGALVTEVIADSPAAGAGLAKDDIIVAVGNTIITQPADLATVVSDQGAGKTIEMAYYRQGSLKKASVALAPTIDPRDAEALPPGARVPAPPVPPQTPRVPGGDRSRIELLERRVAELERRVAELEGLLRNARER